MSRIDDIAMELTAAFNKVVGKVHQKHGYTGVSTTALGVAVGAMIHGYISQLPSEIRRKWWEEFAHTMEIKLASAPPQGDIPEG